MFLSQHVMSTILFDMHVLFRDVENYIVPILQITNVTNDPLDGPLSF